MKSLWQWFLSVFGAFKAVVVKQDKKTEQVTQRKVIERWWR